MMFHRWLIAALVISCSMYLDCSYFSFAQQSNKSTRFFRYELLSIDGLSAESFDLGEVCAGDKLGVQIYLNNHLAKSVSVTTPPNAFKQVQLVSEQTIIGPKDGQLILVTINVPKNPKSLEQSFTLECLLNQEARFMFVFRPKIVKVATFPMDDFQHEFTVTDFQASRISFSVPLLLSDIGDMKRLRATCNAPLTFLSTEFKENNGQPTMQVSFDSKDMQRSRMQGEILLECEPIGASSSLHLTLKRSNELEIFPDRIFLKRTTDSSIFVGEAILKSRNPIVDLSSVQLECEADNGELFECRLERMSDHIGRVYLSLKRNKDSPKNSDFELLFDFSGDGKDCKLFASARIAN